jgi:hypothetical protein
MRSGTLTTRPPSTAIPDTKLVPFSTPRLRGRLVLYYFDSVEIGRLSLLQAVVCDSVSWTCAGSETLYPSCLRRALRPSRRCDSARRVPRLVSSSARVYLRARADREQEFIPSHPLRSIYHGSRPSGLWKLEIGQSISNQPVIPSS